MARTLKQEAAERNAPPPDHGVIRDFVADIKELMGAMAKPRGDIGKAYQEVEKDHGLNRKGLRWLVALEKMAPEARADVLRTFDAGLEALNLRPGPDLVDIMDQRPATTFRDEGEIEADDETPPLDPKATTTAKADAYAAGAKAGEEGANGNTNPYPAGDLHDAWFSGWQAGQAVLVGRMGTTPTAPPAKRGARRAAADAPAFADV